ncbi:MAG: hypothetical protein L0J73_12260, partial [Halomonas sp.]|nr:hypothetical protein [Halomonas sp.]
MTTPSERLPVSIPAHLRPYKGDNSSPAHPDSGDGKDPALGTYAKSYTAAAPKAYRALRYQAMGQARHWL